MRPSSTTKITSALRTVESRWAMTNVVRPRMRASSATATPPVAAASHGTLIIRSVPDHADVFRGEERLGATPLEVPLEAEPITLSLRAAGFAPETIVQAPAEGEVVTTVQLRRRRGGTSGNAAHTPAQLDIKTAR